MSSMCPHCSYETVPGEAFCGQCGKPLAARPVYTEEKAGEASPVLIRYRDAYRVAGAIVAVGKAIKAVGAVLAAVIFLAALSSGSGPFGGAAVVMSGIFVAAVVGILSWVAGVVVAAQGEVLRASLDNTVGHSPFLTDSQRLEAMGLPQTIAAQRAVV